MNKQSNFVYVLILTIFIVMVFMLIGFFGLGNPVPTEPTSPSTTAPTQTQPTIPSTVLPSEPVYTEPVDLITHNDDGKMYAYWVRANGNVGVEYEITAEATATDNWGKMDRITYKIEAPSTFRFRPIEGENVFAHRGLQKSYYSTITGTCFDGVGSDIVRYEMAIDLERGYLIIGFEDGEDLFLVASADQRVEPGYLLQYFSAFISNSKIDN